MAVTKKKENQVGFVDFNINSLFVSNDASIREAMEVIENGRERICLVVDDRKRLIKIISDGDVRRALLKGLKMDDLAFDVHQRTPKTTRLDALDAAQKQINFKIPLIPVLDFEGCVIGAVKSKNIIEHTNIRQKPIAIVGLGYVGLTLALTMANNGFVVYGVEKDTKIVKSLQDRIPTFYENGIKNLLDKHAGNNFLVQQNSDDFTADVYIVTVGTPILKGSQKPDIRHIDSAVEFVGNKLKKNDLVILRSTLPVGFTRQNIVPKLEDVSQLLAGNDFSVAFCPERTSEGKALEELKTLPQIIGGLDENSRELASRLFNENTNTVVDVGSLEGAEMCKLMDNTFRDTVFAYANQMAIFAEAAGLNLNDLISKANLGYERNTIPYPSPGVGGPCLSKDPYILIDNFEKNSLKCPLIKAARFVNEQAPKLIFRRCKKLLAKLGKDIDEIKIFSLGLAFKGYPETSDLRSSTSIDIINYFHKKGTKKISGFDPIVSRSAIQKAGITYSTIQDGFCDASLIMILNNHHTFKDMNLTNLIPKMSSPGVFFDGWNLFSSSDFITAKGVTYLANGNGKVSIK